MACDPMTRPERVQRLRPRLAQAYEGGDGRCRPPAARDAAPPATGLRCVQPAPQHRARRGAGGAGGADRAVERAAADRGARHRPRTGEAGRPGALYDRHVRDGAAAA
ncbi:hypothetical protein WR25_27073 [Diploscapter pachys]|uniref:Uncharacterized protein n=1 Tax=Diploscapter pachys TaxID=2018661 RepID=A0A2A2KBA8_9BILA|nr:hypothetical protein WR25_27073 [Diploscapter pachys]